jgi:hypothetical protein
MGASSRGNRVVSVSLLTANQAKREITRSSRSSCLTFLAPLQAVDAARGSAACKLA